MTAEPDKGPVLLYIIIIGADIRAIIGPDPEIHAVAARLGYLFQLGDRRWTIGREQRFDVVDNGLQRPEKITKSPIHRYPGGYGAPVRNLWRPCGTYGARAKPMASTAEPM